MRLQFSKLASHCSSSYYKSSGDTINWEVWVVQGKLVSKKSFINRYIGLNRFMSDYSSLNLCS